MGDISNKQDKIQCVHHGATIGHTNFYLAGESSLYAGIGRIPVCKSCIGKIAEQYYETFNDEEVAIFFTCRKLDIAFNSAMYEGAKGSGDIVTVFQNYMKQRNSLGSINGTMLSFDEGEDLLKDRKVKNDTEVVFDEMEIVELTEEEKETRKEVIDMLGYDPYLGYPSKDQKFLYSDLINYLSDEDIVDDQYLVSQIIQVVVNNDQVRKLNNTIVQYTSTPEKILAHDSKIKSLTKLKNDIVKSTNDIAKENGITVKSRGGASSGKSSLTKTIKKLEEIGDFDAIEVDYYDQKKAYGMQVSADISMKSLMEQLNLDDADTRDIILDQRKMIKDYQDNILNLEEEKRKLHVELHELKKGGNNG